MTIDVSEWEQARATMYAYDCSPAVTGAMALAFGKWWAGHGRERYVSFLHRLDAVFYEPEARELYRVERRQPDRYDWPLINAARDLVRAAGPDCSRLYSVERSWSADELERAAVWFAFSHHINRMSMALTYTGLAVTAPGEDFPEDYRAANQWLVGEYRKAVEK